MVGFKKMCHVAKTYFHFIYDHYKTAYGLLYHLEVKLHPFKKNPF